MKKRIGLMSLFAKLFVSSAVLVGCASVEIPELRPHITLPADYSGFWVNTLKDEEGNLSPVEWRKKLETEPHIVLFSPDWAKLRFTILKNCVSLDCKQSVGMLDELFYLADDGLKKKKKLTGK